MPSHDRQPAEQAVAATSGDDRIRIRDATPEDAEHVLRLNRAFEHFTSPLTADDLAAMAAEASLYCVAETDGRVAAFLLAFAEYADYLSPNYLWFAERMRSFLYIDRVVVAHDAHRSGLGGRMYRHAFDHAARLGVTRIVCEVDADPPNPTSDAFHRRLGFTEVGSQLVAGGLKRVSLRECLI